MKHTHPIFKLIFELFFVILAFVLAGIITFIVFKTLTAGNKSIDLTGTILREELDIASPVFGTLDKLTLHDGDMVKKGQILATITTISNLQDNNQKTLQTSTIFRFNDDGTVNVVSPDDGVVKILVAQGSVLKPENNFLIMFPFDETTVRFNLSNSKDRLNDYSSFNIIDSSTGKLLELVPTDSLSLDGNKIGRYYYARFKDTLEVKDFYNGQEVLIKAVKK
jgi:hypothetical protein